MRRIYFGFAITALFAGAVSASSDVPGVQSPATTVAAATPMARALAGDWRSPNNIARDVYRHPEETLTFFAVKPDQNVIEIWPGSGWYLEILAPLLGDKGRYVGAVNNPAVATSEKSRESTGKQNQALRDMIAGHPTVFAGAKLVEVDPSKPVFGAPGSADTVLTFRNVHNWMMAGQAEAMFKGFFDVLRPGGTLGVVEHRADHDVPAGDRSGYVSEMQVVAFAKAAGFVLADRSEINANPKDSKDYPGGVWTLPPRLAQGDKDRDKYLAIGESDRMTLRFIKPAR